MLRKIARIASILPAVFLLSACDPNSKPTYGESTGLPSNCRAYVQVAIDAYRNKEYTVDETMAGLERNCGVNGNLWVKQ
jgi:hypothetical protein